MNPQVFAGACVIAVIAIALATAASWVFRPKLRARFPGGPSRYARALVLQATAFFAPFPFAFSLIPDANPLLQLLGGFIGGFGLIYLLRFPPMTRGLVNDLARARLQAALDTFRPERRDVS